MRDFWLWVATRLLPILGFLALLFVPAFVRELPRGPRYAGPSYAVVRGLEIARKLREEGVIK